MTQYDAIVACTQVLCNVLHVSSTLSVVIHVQHVLKHLEYLKHAIHCKILSVQATIASHCVMLARKTLLKKIDQRAAFVIFNKVGMESNKSLMCAVQTVFMHAKSKGWYH